MRNSAIEWVRAIRRRAVAGITRPLHRVGYWLVVTGPKWPEWAVGELKVIDTTNEVDVEGRSVLDRGFALIREFTPWHFSRLERHLRSLVITDQGTTDFAPLLRIGVVVARDLQKKSGEQIGAELVFIAVGARLSSYGWWQQPELRLRLNRIQFEAALHFARRIPGGIPLVEELSATWESRGWQTWSVGEQTQYILEQNGERNLWSRFAGWWHRQLDT
jgi:hypothetical protein